MSRLKYLLVSFFIVGISFSQNPTSSDLLEKAISYHDPDNNWSSFNGTLNIKLEMAEGPARYSKVKINLPEELFELRVIRDSVQTTYRINKERCTTTITDSVNLRRKPCETAELYKNYYTYLYGLPMKLKDPGTIIDPVVSRKTFKGKEYLVLKVIYTEEVGSDVWYFYFDPETYAMEVYQFYKGNPEAEGKNTGEYILLSGNKLINGINIPATRAWYYNKNDGYLGTDILE